MTFRRPALRLAFALLLACIASAASAQRVEGDRARAEGPYATEVPVNGQGEAERRTAFARGLSQVLSKLSGTRNVAALPGVGQELRRAAEYVEGYDYRQDEGVSRTGAPTFRTLLVVRYDGDKVDALAATLGIPVWPQPRPKPVLWLAIDDGRGPRLVGLPQANAARAALDQAIARGYRLGLPSGNAAEQAAVGAIWRGDTAAIARASARYSPPMQLVGKLYRNKGGWTAEWAFVDGGRVLSTWTVDKADARQAMAAGADGAADALVRRYAKRSPVGPPGNYVVTFIGLDTAADYMRLSGYLQGLPVVRRIVPVRATAGGVELELELLSGLPGFRRVTDAGDVLAPVEGDTPVYQLR
ncbi:DUF2066 domain-containing protein [Tolypothrix campylonemoides VB511288]|nr:DUF2066 domain-containing protein [Tolypothrix campylonemoides VB511288]